MNVFALIMYLLAFLCFLIGAFGAPRLPNATLNPVALGLAFAILPTLASAVTRVA